MKTYVTFGQAHVHRINGKTLDCDCIAVVNGDRSKVLELFGTQFCLDYPEDKFNMDLMKYFPRGFVEI